MNNFTTKTYEMKREILTFSKKITKGLNKSTNKFVMDMEYGIAKSKSVIMSEISRSLNEEIKLKNTIERLCDNLNDLTKEECEIIRNNYQEETEKYFPEEPIAIFDNSDIAKEYGKKFEDLDIVIDASDKNQNKVSGYHVCEAVVLTEKEKQWIVNTFLYKLNVD